MELKYDYIYMKNDVIFIYIIFIYIYMKYDIIFIYIIFILYIYICLVGEGVLGAEVPQRVGPLAGAGQGRPPLPHRQRHLRQHTLYI